MCVDLKIEEVLTIVAKGGEESASALIDEIARRNLDCLRNDLLPELLKKREVENVLEAKARYDLAIFYVELSLLIPTMKSFEKEMFALIKIKEHLRKQDDDYFKPANKVNKEIISYQLWKFYRVFQFKEFLLVMIERIRHEYNTITTPGNRVVEMIDEAFLWPIANQSSDNKAKYVQNYYSEAVLQKEFGENFNQLSKKNQNTVLEILRNIETDESKKKLLDGIELEYWDYLKQLIREKYTGFIELTTDDDSVEIKLNDINHSDDDGKTLIDKILDLLKQLSVEDNLDFRKDVWQIEFLVGIINEETYRKYFQEVYKSNKKKENEVKKKISVIKTRLNTDKKRANIVNDFFETYGKKERLYIKKSNPNGRTAHRDNNPYALITMIYELSEEAINQENLEKISYYQFLQNRLKRQNQLSEYKLKQLFMAKKDIASLSDIKAIIHDFCCRSGFGVHLDHTVSRKSIKRYIEEFLIEETDKEPHQVIYERVDDIVRYIFGCLLTSKENIGLNKTKKDEGKGEDEGVNLNDIFQEKDEKKKVELVFNSYVQEEQFTIYEINSYDDQREAFYKEENFNLEGWLKDRRIVHKRKLHKENLENPYDTIQIEKEIWNWDDNERTWIEKV